MPPRSKATLLPTEQKAWLDKTLVEFSFADYEKLEILCRDNGIEISRSSLHRYGSQYEKSLFALKLATDQCIAIAEAVPDGENAMSDTILRLVQQKTFETLMAMNSTQDIPLDKLAKIATDTAFAGNAVKEFGAKVKAKVAAAEKAVTAIVKQAGLSPDKVKEIKTQFLGLGKIK